MQAATDADLAEGAAVVRDAQRVREERVVAELRMRVEREVVRRQAEVPREKRLEPAALAAVDPDRLVAPEHAVMDEHELRARRGGSLEELA